MGKLIFHLESAFNFGFNRFGFIEFQAKNFIPTFSCNKSGLKCNPDFLLQVGLKSKARKRGNQKRESRVTLH